MAIMAKKLKISEDKIIKLDANENLFISKSFFSTILKDLAEDIDPRLYPRREKNALTDSLVNYLRIPPEYLILGNSSDELLEITVRTLLLRGEEAISITPTFVMYRIIVNAQGNKYIEAPLNDDFSLNTDPLLAKVNSKTILCFLCSPNNPTGNQFKIDTIKEVLERFRGVVVVDEAYVEFASYSIKNLVMKYDNLMVVRTFSKAFGLAGLRIGYAIANPSLTSVLKKRQLPYNINKVSLEMARMLLERRDVIESVVKEIKEERGRFATRLTEVPGVRVFPSEANFILFKTEVDTEAVREGLLRRGILVRDVGDVLNWGRCLRVTVGPPELNLKLLEALEETCRRLRIE